ncbi:hypothetical protein AV530_012638 [Patagioenas fasciata monilis]|uniref:Uncharacterized protein n=1 Tax=Patagioenas fasciata monilis TaxID=372326 RepID=A0A1V4JCY8_PATFA|nr:hypothetical protein AV530_012638 [Patagioenas fasciata monilis]
MIMFSVTKKSTQHLIISISQKYAYPSFSLINSNKCSFAEVTYERKYQQETYIILPFKKKIISVPPRVNIFIFFCKRKLLPL